MLAIQVLVVAFALFALSRVVVRFRKRTIGIVEFAVWFSFWIAVGAVGVTPDTTHRFAALLGVGRGVDAVSYVTLLMLCYLVFRQRMMVRTLEQQLTQLVRKLALERPVRRR
jgi:hypothetical protein